MTAIEICTLISIIIAAALLYWTGYRGGLTDGRIEGYDEGHAKGHTQGIGESETEKAVAIAQANARCQHLTLLLKREPQDRATLLSIVEKLKLAADTFSALKSDRQAIQALELCNKALRMADRLEPLAQEDAA